MPSTTLDSSANGKELSMKNTVKRLLAAAIDLYRRYPARVTSYIVAALVTGGSAVGIAVDPQSTQTVIRIVLPILVTGEAIHHRVKPAR